MAKPIMIQGTMSNAGKSLITAALCRIFRQDGYSAAPFKSQNMALNSFITAEGAEMGRAQVVQAEAANIEPSVLMNPILLKPTSDSGSQVIVNGEAIGTMKAGEYYAMKHTLRPEVQKAFDTLASKFDIVCIEGAGSSTIRIEGRRGLSGCCFSPLPDRIFASTLACGCAAAGGRVELTGCAPALYAPVLEILGQMGCRVEPAGDTVRISRFGRLHGAGRVFTGAYPALATDAAPLLAAAMLCADSESSIEDVIFERRFGCAEGFCRLGAQAEAAGRVLTIAPGGLLRGTVVDAPDLRGGAALVLAGLAARGTTVITHPAHIERGYAGFTEILAGLGAQIRRESARGNGSVKKTSAKKQICLAIGAKR